MTRRDLLEWLAKEDESLLGECDGPLLRELERDGLVSIRLGPKYSRVSLTEAGWKEVRHEAR